MDVYEYGDLIEHHSNDNEKPEVTAYAVYGMSAPKSIKTMKVSELVLNCLVIFMVDSSSSHNFIDISLAK